MNRLPKVRVVSGLIFVLAVAFACSNPRDSAADRPAETSIGTILGLTGDNASYGQKMQRGFEFALDQAQPTAGGVGKRARLIVENSEFDPGKAVSAYRKLTGAEGVRIIVGITGSKNALPVCEAAKTDNSIIVDALSSAPNLSTRCGKNYFRVMASDSLAGLYNVNWAMESDMKRPVIVYMEDDWGSSYRDATLGTLSQHGFAEVPVHGVTEGSRDFRSIVEKLKRAQPDTVFLLLYPKEGAGFMQQMKQAGIRATVYGSDNLSSTEFTAVGNEVVEGVRVALPAPTAGPKFEEFSKKYTAKYGEAPDAILLKSYDAMALVVDALRNVGADPAKIGDYLRSPAFQFSGISGIIKFDAHGDLTTQEYSRLVYKLGKLEPAK